MLVYEKKVDDNRHLFFTNGNIPSEDDVQVEYKDINGAAVELTITSDLRDNGKGGMTLDGAEVQAFGGEFRIIPKSDEQPQPTPVVPVKDEEELKAALEEGGEVKLTSSIEVKDTLTLSKDTEIDLAGKTLSAKEAFPETAPFFMIADGCNLNIKGNGVIDAYGKGYALYAKNGGSVSVDNAEVKGDTTAIQCAKGSVVINGGKFEAAPYDDGKGGDQYRYTINCIDKYYKQGTAKIEIKGGEFYKFNPADNASEGEHTNYVPEGFKAVESGDYFTVIPE